MRKFEQLTSHIQDIQKGNFLKEQVRQVEDRPSDGKRKIIALPIIEYSDEVRALNHDIINFCKLYPEYGLRNYRDIIERSGVSWDEVCLSSEAISTLDAKTILAFLVQAVRAEKFCGGALMGYLEDGAILRWLERLNELDQDNFNAH